MHNLLLVAKREYVERIKTRGFKIATVLIPLLMIGGIKLATHGAKSEAHIAIVSNDVNLAGDLQAELTKSDDSNMQVDVMEPAAGWKQKLDRRVDAKELDGYLLIESGKDEPGITYSSASKGDIATKGLINSALRRVLTRERLEHRGMKRDEIDALLKTPVMETETVSNGKSAKSDTQSGFFAAYGLFFLMYFMVMLHGINVASSVVEEKTSRVFEVMLAAVKPADMMGGKILGVGAVGLTQVAIWIGCLAAIMFTPIMASMGAGGFKLQLSVQQLAFFVIYFVLGFLLYSAIAAAIGAMVSSEQELRQLNMLIAMPMAINTVVLVPIITAPNSMLSRVLSFIPTSTPLLMFMRMSVGGVGPVELALSVLDLLVAIAIVVWFAAKIYRVGILMYGKRPNLPEILKWLRYS